MKVIKGRQEIDSNEARDDFFDIKHTANQHKHINIPIEEFRAISNEILGELAEEDEVIGKVYDSYIKFKNNVTEYHKISEDSFIEARNK